MKRMLSQLYAARIDMRRETLQDKLMKLADPNYKHDKGKLIAEVQAMFSFLDQAEQSVRSELERVTKELRELTTVATLAAVRTKR